jgi:glutamate-ammonia-ligase adenylyltransferase
VQQLKRIVRPAQAGLAYSDIAAGDDLGAVRPVERASPSSTALSRPAAGRAGLGKLGSREMSATSDLDLIFVYDIPPGLEASDGPQPLRRSSTTRGSAPRS